MKPGRTSTTRTPEPPRVHGRDRAERVDAQHALELRPGELARRPGSPDPGVRDDEVEPAGLVVPPCDLGPHRRRVGDVDRRDVRAPARRANLAGEVREPLDAPRGQDDPRPAPIPEEAPVT
jgi:hypothetical protein